MISWKLCDKLTQLVHCILLLPQKREASPRPHPPHEVAEDRPLRACKIDNFGCVAVWADGWVIFWPAAVRVVRSARSACEMWFPVVILHTDRLLKLSSLYACTFTLSNTPPTPPNPAPSHDALMGKTAHDGPRAVWLELVRGRAPVGFPYMLALFTCSASTVFHVHCSVKPTSGFFFFLYTSHIIGCVLCVCFVCVCCWFASAFLLFFCLFFGITLSMLC